MQAGMLLIIVHSPAIYKHKYGTGMNKKIPSITLIANTIKVSGRNAASASSSILTQPLLLITGSMALSWFKHVNSVLTSRKFRWKRLQFRRHCLSLPSTCPGHWRLASASQTSHSRYCLQYNTAARRGRNAELGFRKPPST